MSQAVWQPRLTAEAAKDLVDIVRWTRRKFGAEQARIYRATILAALRELERGPEHPAARSRDSVVQGVKTLHIARHGQTGRHLLVFRVKPEQQRIIQVLRILHDAMDLPRHLESEQ